MSARASIAHRMPGRIRLSIPARRGDAAFFAGLAGQLSGQPDVIRVRPNVRTGSLLVEHAGDAEPILAWAAQEHLLELEPSGASMESAGLLSAPGPAVRLVTGRDIDPMFMAGVAFLGMGLVQIVRGQVMVPAATALWYAISVFPQWQRLAAAVPATTGDD
jgi:hypothetical protein